MKPLNQNKMTAVEWLIEELRGAHVKGDFIFNGVITSELIEQAKEMEEINLHLEYMKGWRDGCNNQESVTDDTL
jgi:hypothetical protein